MEETYKVKEESLLTGTEEWDEYKKECHEIVDKLINAREEEIAFDEDLYMEAIQDNKFREAVEAYAKRDFEKAFSLYGETNRPDNPFVLTRRALCYYYGEGCQTNISFAQVMFARAAKAGDPLAACWLGEYYRIGKLSEKDPTIGNVIFEKYLPAVYAMAKAGDMYAQYFYAYNMLFSLGVSEDDEKAVILLKKSTEQRCGAAMSRLAWCYYKGIGVEKDLEKIPELLEENVPEEPVTRHFLNGIYDYFKVETNSVKNESELLKLEKALKELKKAAMSGNSNSMLILAEHYYYGMKKTEPDINEAIKWFKMAADKGSSQACKQLSKIYILGDKIIEKNDSLAWKYFVLAAEKNDPESMRMLGEEYLDNSIFNGKFVKQDMKSAKYWLLKAARAGDDEAFFVLTERFDIKEEPIIS